MEKLKRLSGTRKPSDAELLALRIWAEELAEHYDLDKRWIEKILTNTIDKLGFESDHRRTFPGNLVLRNFRPSILNALEAMPINQVKKLFNQDEESLLQLKLNEKRWSALQASPLPIQTFERMLHIADDFKKYLKNSIDEVVKYGQPLKPFAASEWLQWVFTDCNEVSPVNAEALSGYDDDADEISSPPVLSSIAEIIERDSKAARITSTEQDKNYRYGANGKFSPPDSFQSRITLLIIGKKATEQQEDLGKKIRRYSTQNDFIEKEKALRIGVHRFSEECFSYFVHVMKNRKNRNGIALAENLVAECWQSLTKNLNSDQIDVLTGKSLAYFALDIPDHSPKLMRWRYGTRVHRSVFIVANLMERIISGSWDHKIQKPLEGIADIFQHAETGDEHFGCSYHQAVAVCEKENVDAALRAFEQLKDQFREAKQQVAEDLTGTVKVLEGLGKEKEVAFLDKRAIDRIKAMGGYVVFPEDKRKSTLKEIEFDTSRPAGMINDCEAYYPKDGGDPILFNGAKQRAVIRFLFSKCDRKNPKYSATVEEIIRDVCTEEEAKEIVLKEKAGKWRLDNFWFQDHPAWKLRLLDSVPKSDPLEPLVYYLDFDYKNKPLRKPRLKKDKSQSPTKKKSQSQKRKRGKGITFSKNVKKKAAL